MTWFYIYDMCVRASIYINIYICILYVYCVCIYMLSEWTHQIHFPMLSAFCSPVCTELYKLQWWPQGYVQDAIREYGKKRSKGATCIEFKSFLFCVLILQNGSSWNKDPHVAHSKLSGVPSSVMGGTLR